MDQFGVQIPRLKTKLLPSLEFTKTNKAILENNKNITSIDFLNATIKIGRGTWWKDLLLVCPG